MRAVYNAFSHIEGVINSGHDIWRFIFQGPKLADAQTCGPYAEYKSPSITLLNFITPSKYARIHYKLPAYAHLQGGGWYYEIGRSQIPLPAWPSVTPLQSYRCRQFANISRIFESFIEFRSVIDGDLYSA